MTRRWVNNDRIFTFVWTIPFQLQNRTEGSSEEDITNICLICGPTSMSILMRVIRWKGSNRKDMKGSRWHSGDSCSRVITAANWVLLCLRWILKWEWVIICLMERNHTLVCSCFKINLSEIEKIMLEDTRYTNISSLCNSKFGNA